MFTKIRVVSVLLICAAVFSPVAFAEDMTIRDAVLARHFEDLQLSPAPNAPRPFSFVYDGQPSSALLPSWNATTADKKLDTQRTERSIVFTDPKTGLQVRCVATHYADFPAVEWVLYFKNTGAADTPIIENIQAIDTTFAAPLDRDCRLYYAEGSHALITDFRPMEKPLAVGDKLPLASFGGRSSDGFLPFFNLACNGGGVIAAVGWTGQWAAEFARTNDAVRLRAGMEQTHLVLHPGEEIRSPGIILLFWSGDDRARSQNLFRSFMLSHCTPRPNGRPIDPPVAVSPHAEIPFEGTTEANTVAVINRIADHQLLVNYWWIDAGWYDCDKNWARWVGTWEPSPERFPNGLKPVADAARSKGMKFLLWFEPERVMPDTWLFKNHPEWLLAPPPAESLAADIRYMSTDGFHLLNLGNPDALAWAKDHFGGMIKDLGIDIYRNDFNMYPLYYWRNGEAPDRQGINEIRYVTGLYDYFDTLAREHPGLMLDDCASGGRRIDFEMLRRALVLTRSDYLWDPIGQQCHTYGLAQWIPLTGIGAASTQPYECRSGMGAHYALAINTSQADPAAWSAVKDFLDSYQSVRPLFQGDFYPLSPYSTESNAVLAFQFHRPDLNRGIVQVFRRPDCPDDTYTCRLQGLDPKKTYTLTDWDNNPPQTLTGQELMDQGITIPIKDKPAAAVLVYQQTTQ
jgi:alpha-galactosidase